MTYIPKAFCGNCRIEMRVSGLGVRLMVSTETCRPYYKIKADSMECPTCDAAVYIGIAKEPYAFDHEADFNTRGHDDDVTLYNHSLHH